MLSMPAPFRMAAAAAAQLVDGFLCPPTCVACDFPTKPANRGLCDGCRDQLPMLTESVCHRCATPVPAASGVAAYDACAACRDKRFRFDEVIAAGEYDGLLRDLALQAKQSAHEQTAYALGELIAVSCRERLLRCAPDIVASVPMHWTRRLVRQANAPELIAERIAASLGAQADPRLLVRARRTAPQSRLARSRRAANVRRALRVRSGYRLKGATVALVDDILTTGATCNAAAQALKRAGASRVVVVVAARSL